MRDPLLFWASFSTATYIAIYLTRIWPTGQLASPSSLYAALVALHFAVPGMVFGLKDGPDYVFSPNGHFAAEAMLFAFASLLTFQIGSFLVNSNILRRRHRLHGATRPFWSRNRVFAFVVALLIVGWLARIDIIESNAYFQILRSRKGSLEGAFYAAISMAEMLPIYAACILAIVYWRPNASPSRLLRLSLACVVVSEIVYWLPSGRKEAVVLAVVLPLLARYLQRRKLPSGKTFGALLIGVVLLFQGTNVYRSAMERGRTGGDQVDTVVAAVTLAETGTVSADMSSDEFIFRRMSLLEPLSACIRLNRHGIWEPMLGSSYAQALWSFVPRVLWPEKPNLHYGTEFGHAAGVLPRSDVLTSISVTYFGEAFLNFAWGGLVPIFLVGMIFGGLYRQIRASLHRETWLLVYLVAMPTILYIGGTFAIYFGGLIKLLPFFYIVGWLVERSGAVRPYVGRKPGPSMGIG